MPNDYFRFKQFTIYQDRCAMKVTIDACIFGAWVPVPEGARRILDVGAGTGLLSLMLAQRFPDVEIDAVEIDENAAKQAAENVAASPYADRIKVIHADVREFRPTQPYDFIFSNPPFFEDAFPGPDIRRNTARHAGGISMRTIFWFVKNILAHTGKVAVLSPAALHYWAMAFESGGWLLHDVLSIHSFAERARHCVGLIADTSPAQNGLRSLDLIVYNKDRSLTSEAADLLRPFYLNL